MKKFSVLAIMAVVSLGIVFSSCNSKSGGSVKLTSEVDSISYMFGKVQGSQASKQMEGQFNQWPVKGNMEAFIAGFNNGFENADDSLLLGKDMQEANEYVGAFFQKAQGKIAEEEKAAGDKFLAENKTKSGVITNESGLQYKVITEGKGAKPTEEDVVKVHYVLRFIDGTEVESSLNNGEPVTFPLANVIPGWREGVQLMPVGSKYILWVPGEIGYGMQPPQGSPIKPNSTLEFEVELLEIVKQ